DLLTQGESVVDEVVQAHAQTMRTRIRLHQHPSAIRAHLERERGHSARLKPGARPRAHIAAGYVLPLDEQILERGVAVGVRSEVSARTLEEVLFADESDELFEDGRSLGVGDAVEVQLRGFEIDDVSDDRMRRGELILLVRPGLAVRSEAN